MRRIGIVGLGIMGSAYARNLIGAGFEVIGSDIEAEAVADLNEIGGRALDTCADIAAESDVVLIALPTVHALKDAVLGQNGLINGAHPHLTIVEMSTFPLFAKESAREAFENVGVVMLDAPVSGTGLQAAAAEIVVYASGERESLDRVTPVFDAIAKTYFGLGEFGNGSRMKFVANLLVSIHNLATAEAFVLGMKSGLAPSQILDVISAGVGSSRIFDIRGPMIVEDAYPPAARMRMFIKDVSVIGDFARSIGVPTPLLDASLPWYEDAVRAGLGDLDAAALTRILEAEAGLER